MDKDKDKKTTSDSNELRWLGIGIEFCVVVGVFTWLGNLLDKVEDTSPAWLVMGFFVGFGTMLYRMIKSARDETRNDKK